MEVSTAAVKQLRDKTSAGVMDCRRALLETGGDFDNACAVLRQWGLAKAEKRSGCVSAQGLIESYVHQGSQIAALVEVNCETDFVAHTEEFKTLAHNIALQVAATAPLHLSQAELPEDADEYQKSLCLLDQAFIKDNAITIQDLINEVIAKVGENINVGRFVRLRVGC